MEKLLKEKLQKNCTSEQKKQLMAILEENLKSREQLKTINIPGVTKETINEILYAQEESIFGLCNAICTSPKGKSNLTQKDSMKLIRSLRA